MDHLADAPIANILIIAGVIFLAVGLFGRVGGFIGSIFGNIEAGNSSRVLAGVLGGFLIIGGAWLHQLGDKAAAKNPAVAGPTAAGSTAPATAAPSPTAVATPAVASDPKPVNPAPRPPATTTSSASQPSPSPTSRARAASPEAPVAAATREKIPTSAPPAIADDRVVATWTNVIPKNGTIHRIEVLRDGQYLDAHLWFKCSPQDCDYGVHRLAASGRTFTFDYNTSDRHMVGSMSVYAKGLLLLTMDISQPGTEHRWHHNRVLSSDELSGKTISALSRYLDSDGQKAFAMTPAGAWTYHLKSPSADEAVQTVLHNCEEHALRDCRVILVNDEGPER